MPFFATVNGANFRPASAKEAIASAAENFNAGEEVTFTLERDHENQYDPNAIRVIYDDEWIGFIEKGVAAEIAPLMDEDAEFTCIVHSWLSTLKPYVQLTEV